MEYSFNCESLLGANTEGICIIDSSFLKSKKCNPQIMAIIDRLGDLSAKSQGLKAVITTGLKLLSSDHRLYILAKKSQIIGMIKVGPKTLFIRNEIGQISEIRPLCCLDFYVYEAIQRSGYGKFIYEAMLRHEGVSPSKLGYDRPSSKFIGFLKKHYSLCNYVPQNNNYVVFKEYFKASIDSLHDRPFSKAGKDILGGKPPMSSSAIMMKSHYDKKDQAFTSIQNMMPMKPPKPEQPKSIAVYEPKKAELYSGNPLLLPWASYMSNPKISTHTASSEIGSFLHRYPYKKL